MTAILVILGSVGVAVFGVNLVVSAVAIGANHDLITAVNTLLNFASWYILIKAQHKLRTEATPKLEHIEETVTAVAEQVNSQTPSAIEGGRRHYDPPCNGEDK